MGTSVKLQRLTCPDSGNLEARFRSKLRAKGSSKEAKYHDVELHVSGKDRRGDDRD
jgi:hypothetical protein